MFDQHKDGVDKPSVIHQYYMEIINSLPDAVYWMDVNCNLIGCNLPFLHLLHLKNAQGFKDKPYELLKQHALWSDSYLETLKLDDMSVIFSGNPQYNREEKIITSDNKTFYFKINRVPIHDEHRGIIGLVVVLSNISHFKELQEEMRQQSKNNPKSVELAVNDHRFPKVLMIEDNLIAQNVERALLTSLNCEVDIAGTGEHALQLFNPGKYDLVLMDIGLEDTSGYIVAKNLRNKEKDTPHHVPIIALTGYQAEIVKYDCGQYCMEGAITKPLTSLQAEQIIKHYVYNMDIEIHGLKSI